jgi:hypothetical protein
MKFSASVIVILAVLLSVSSAGLMLFLNYDDLFKPAPVVKAEFTSVEFDADDTSYSPAEKTLIPESLLCPWTWSL